jgi:tRNA dimethylallyltransferase
MSPFGTDDIDLIVVLGPTASGKTRLGAGLARARGGEIISADSRQVYRGMDIGTGKDLSEYGDILYHLIDIVEPGHEFNLFEFQHRFIDAYKDVHGRGRLPILVGGTGMYLQAVLQGYSLVETPPDPCLRRELADQPLAALAERLKRSGTPLHNTTDLIDRNRLIRAIEIAEHDPKHGPAPFPEIKSIVFGIRWERTVLRQRITARLRERLDEGMLEEVERLHSAGVPWETLEFYGLEYRFIARHLKGELNFNDMFQKLNSAIHDFAKRQETWFRRMERDGILIRWLDGAGDPLKEALRTLAPLGKGAPY